MGAKVGVLPDQPPTISDNKNNEAPSAVINLSDSTTPTMTKTPRQPPTMQPSFDSLNQPPGSNNNNNINNNVLDEDTRVVRAPPPTKFINFEAITDTIDIKSLTNIFNSYATRKTLATGFFNLALVATNFAQMKQLIAPPQGRTTTWTPLNIVLMTFIGLSLLLQFVVGILLVFLAKQGEFIDEEKRNRLIRNNNGATLLVVAISIINIFINVFISI